MQSPDPAPTREIAFTPATPEDAKAEPGTGYLTPGGLVVHSGWSMPLEGPQVLRQHPAYEGGSTQCWHISTPRGHRAARFSYLTRPDGEAAAARITAALPGGMWPADADTAALLPLTLEVSSAPALLPLTHHGKPDWGSGYGGHLASFQMPDTRADYQRMIDAHGGPVAKNCQACHRMAAEQKKHDWAPNTHHWPQWSVPTHRGARVRPHCMCGVCLGMYRRIGGIKLIVDQTGATVPASMAVSPWTRLPEFVGSDVPREERPFAWFRFFLQDSGCVVIDERDIEGLWPRGIRHDDALFSETGVSIAPDEDATLPPSSLDRYPTS